MNNKYDAVQIVRDFLRINTTNPPGNEEEAIYFLEDLLRNENIECRIFSPLPKRANLLARIEGKKRGKPVILLSHIDVVPANASEWDADPFGGEVIEGFIYGRGAIDMKAQAICQLLAFVLYHQAGIVPERDIIYLATCDEEVGGTYGVEYMLKEVPELRDASFVLSEGGFMRDENGFVHAQVSVAEKKLSQFLIKATGTGGHGSMPHKDNANEKIIHACSGILSHVWPMKATPVVSAYLKGIFEAEKTGGETFLNLEQALKHRRFLDYVENVPFYNALLRNTVTPTILQGGEKVNVIPAESSASFDARLLPGENQEIFFKKIEKLAGKDVKVVRVSNTSTDPVASGYKTPYFKGLRKVIEEIKGEKFPVLPCITTGATDLRYFRDLGIPAFGFFPITLSNDEFHRMHAKNERISVDNVHEGLHGTYKIIKFLGSQNVL